MKIAFKILFKMISSSDILETSNLFLNMINANLYLWLKEKKIKGRATFLVTINFRFIFVFGKLVMVTVTFYKIFTI